VIACLPQVEINTELELPPHSEEVKKAVKQLCNGKAPDVDSIPSEVYKAGGTTTVQKLTGLFCEIWKRETMPADFRNASKVHLYKHKGNHQQCDNHRAILLLSTAGKIVARALLKCLTHHMEQGLLPQSQCCFRPRPGSIDMIFGARQLQEKCQELYCDPCTTFVDLSKAFDTVSGHGLWKIMAKFGCLTS